MSFREIKLSAKESLQGKRKTSVGAWVIYLLLSGGISGFLAVLTLPVSVFFSNDPLTQQAVIQVPTLFSIFALFPLAVGLYWLHLDIYDKKEVQVGHLFHGFSPYWKVVGAYVLVSLYTFLWTLLFIVPGIVKGLAYSQTFYLLKENPDLSINGAITESRRLMDGNKWRYFAFHLSFIGWYLPIMAAYGIGLATVITTLDSGSAAIWWGIGLLLFSAIYGIFLFFYFIPYYYTADAGFFRKLVAKEES